MADPLLRARIRFVQFDILFDVVHGPDAARGFPLPPEYDGWEPFQVEVHGSQKGDGYIVLAMWLREVTE